MFVIVVSIHVKPAHEQQYLDLCRRVLDATHYAPTFVSQDPEGPTRFMAWETWADPRYFFQVQTNREYGRAYETRLPEIVSEPRTMKVWHPLRGGFALLAPGAEPLAAHVSGDQG